MRLVLTGRNVDITPHLRQLVERRVGKVQRLLNDHLVSAQVVLWIEKYRHVADITMHARGDHMLHAVGDGGTWPLSMSEAVDKITQQAHTLKDKWDTRRRRADGRRSLAAPAVGAREAPSRVVRAARYPIKPMSVEDAALSIDDSGEAFLVFRNAATEGVNIVYRRKDGRVGLIEPE
jgi:putative sigma-54 modulation protein